MKSEYSLAEAYEILELPHGASVEAAEATYRKLAIQVHPDRFQNNPKMRLHAEEEQRKLNEAIRTLRIRLKEHGYRPSEANSPEPEPPRSSTSEPPQPQTPPQSEFKAPPHPDPPQPQTTTPPPAPEPAASPRVKKAPTWRTQMWGLFCAVFVVAKIVTTLHGWYQGDAKERSETNGAVAAPVPRSSDAKANNSQATAIRGTVPDVQVYIASDAESLVKMAGLTEAAIKEVVRQGLTQRQIVSIHDNAVIEGEDDWISVRLLDKPDQFGSHLHIELSVRNGVSSNFQLVRWQWETTIDALDFDDDDVRGTLTRLMDTLKGDFNSAAYKAGRQNWIPQ